MLNTNCISNKAGISERMRAMSPVHIVLRVLTHTIHFIFTAAVQCRVQQPYCIDQEKGLRGREIYLRTDWAERQANMYYLIIKPVAFAY